MIALRAKCAGYLNSDTIDNFSESWAQSIYDIKGKYNVLHDHR